MAGIFGKRQNNKRRSGASILLAALSVCTLAECVAVFALPSPRQAVPPTTGGRTKSATALTDSRLPHPELRNFWSFQPVRRPKIPTVKLREWVKTPLDAFVLAKLEAKGLKPASPADKRTLLRRATFDLMGLPPTPAEIEAFLADKSPNAYEKVIDRLLASPAYGERWGRHWLDLVRYADSADARGIGSEGDISEAWRYRDWVVDALNRDMPYNLFMMSQIAGDLLPVSPDTNAAAKDKKEAAGVSLVRMDNKGAAGEMNIPGVIATGMLAIGNWGNGDADKDKILTDIADDQVDVVSRAFMGLTVACARCHDHKFDPISTKDYYGLAGIFFSSHILPKLTPKGQGEAYLQIPLLTQAETAQRAAYAADVAEREKRLQSENDAQRRAFAKSLLPQTARYITAAWEYGQRPAAQSNLSLADFAAKNGLHEYAVRQWAEFLGLEDYRLMLTPISNVLSNAGVNGWKGDADTPSLVVNSAKEAKSILTFTLPPRSVSMHPGPTTGVAVGWKSPITGTVRITGRVADADPACGDGIAWIVDYRTSSGVRELTSGDISNGGTQDFSQGKTAPNLDSVTVKTGDSIQLLVLPKASHACDTTTIDLTITETKGGQTWNLTRDIVDDIHEGGKGNPHSDHYGTPGVWHFYDMANSRRISPAGEPNADTPQAQWQRTLAAAMQGEKAQPDTLHPTPYTLHPVERAAQEFAKTFTLDDARSPSYPSRPDDEKFLPETSRAVLGKMREELDALKKQAPPPIQYANGVQEGGVPESPQAGLHDVRVHIRGSYLRLGDVVPRRFPVVLAGANQPPITKGSGRLELARWLASDTHPLTPRVIVNRVWQQHFGQGIVRTPNNFGFLGERPTHPELLDWLASAFVARGKQGCGWSLKKLHRLIMLSATYQQASIASPSAMKQDPDNRLFGRMNRRRLEAEALRDNLLAVSGRLDRTMGGVAVRDFNSPRRTLYITTIRSDRSGYGPLFDGADPNTCVERRTVSNVAPQALFLMNNLFALEQAKALAKRLLAEVPNNATARIRAAYLLLYGRPPAPEEIVIGQKFLTGGKSGADGELSAWEAYCQILLCANEFLYVD